MTSDALALVDLGFLVALCDRRDTRHEWAVSAAKGLRGPWLTCEACICETDHLLDYIVPPQSRSIYDLLQSGAFQSQHLLPEQLARVHSEIARYRDRRVDFADACLVILRDEHPKLPVVTTDAFDFAVYFRGRASREFVLPPRSRNTCPAPFVQPQNPRPYPVVLLASDSPERFNTTSPVPDRVSLPAAPIRNCPARISSALPCRRDSFA